ncbi:hypothetical protein GCM10025884_07120 [Leuconostoc gelidum subsp. gelidum]|nr:hypothetical protein GCM10025884_07120 [Leuconostoc gelidum subsp. gelidum]
MMILLFMVSNFCLDAIISRALPILMLLYTIENILFNNVRIVYMVTMVLKYIPIILDGIKSLLTHIYYSETIGHILYRIRRHRLICIY